MSASAFRVLSVLFACSLFALSGCNTIGYYFQAIDGQLDVMRRAMTFEEAIAKSGGSETLRIQLARVSTMREFASRNLALPDNGSYRRYADLGRPYVLWNVFATPEFSVRPAESCFPFAGCVAYRGFFAEADARSYAQQLADRGLDIHVGGVVAYSTLGWFDDPVLSTFSSFPEAELARIIFHELAHQVVYVRDDSQFNESFAVAVEQEGVRRWLEDQYGIQAREAMQRWIVSQGRRAEFLALLIRHRDILAGLYASAASETDKRAAKTRQMNLLQSDYGALKKSWGGFEGYDRFLAQGANNALLASVAVYADYVPAFAARIGKHQGDMGAFYTEVRQLAGLEKNSRAEALRASVDKARF